LQPPAEGAPHAREFEEALTLAARGSWRAALRKFLDLSSKDAKQPELWRNIAVLRGWLADQEGAVAALRKFAALDVPLAVSLDDAVEAEALAQLLDDRATGDEIELLRVVIDIADAEDFVTRLATSPRVVAAPTPPSMDDDAPPPRAMYAVLDRDKASSGADLRMENVPLVLGHMLVYGKQTDRAARVELLAYRGERQAGALAALREIAGGSLASEPHGEETLAKSRLVDLALTPAWILPDDTTPDQADSLTKEFWRDAIFERLPELPMASLKGKSLATVAADESLRIAALAVILNLELSHRTAFMDIDFNELRRRLGLPTAEQIPAAGVNAEQSTLARLARVAAEELADEDLVTLYRKAAMTQHFAAIHRLGKEVVARKSLDEKVDKAEAYAILARNAISSDEIFDYLAKAQAAAAAQGESPARWLIEELLFRLRMGGEQNVAEAARLIEVLRKNHFSEPGVEQTVYRLLAEIRAAAGRMQGAALAEGGPQAELATAGAGQSKLWTPGSEQGGGGKLWTPD
jgi:hypothetical protein